jgi:SAM-dependent methyltransferase
MTIENDDCPSTDTSNLNASYDGAFFDANEQGSYRSGCTVLQLLFKIIKPDSVLDIGCGLGTWLKAARGCGAEHIAGIDGPHVPRDRLYIESEAFTAADLTDPSALTTAIAGRRFDLTMCLETVEHLPADLAREFVAILARTSDVVLWSAAIPGQGGTHHVNERLPAYWASLWWEHGFRALDCLRPALQSAAVDIWYVQNAMLFVACGASDAVAARADAYYRDGFGYVPPLGFVHPYVLSRWLRLTEQKLSDSLMAISLVFERHFLVAAGVGRSFVRTEYPASYGVAWVTWTAAVTVPSTSVIMCSLDGISVSVGLYFPDWQASEAQLRVARERTLALGLSWDDPVGRKLKGWSEIGDRSLLPRLSFSLLDDNSNDAAIRELAREAVALWLRYEDRR